MAAHQAPPSLGFSRQEEDKSEAVSIQVKAGDDQSVSSIFITNSLDLDGEKMSLDGPSPGSV